MLVFKKEKMRWEKNMSHEFVSSLQFKCINQLGLAEYFLPLWKMMEWKSVGMIFRSQYMGK